MECVEGGSKRCRDQGREGCWGFQAVSLCCRWDELHLGDAARAAPHSQLCSSPQPDSHCSLLSLILACRKQTVMQLQAVSSLCAVPFLNFGCFFMGLTWQILWDKSAVFTFVFIEHLGEILARLGHSAFLFLFSFNYINNRNILYTIHIL